jgi:hypothetical protein
VTLVPGSVAFSQSEDFAGLFRRVWRVTPLREATSVMVATPKWLDEHQFSKVTLTCNFEARSEGFEPPTF